MDEIWPGCGWDLADGYSAACQCQSANIPGFDPSKLWHSIEAEGRQMKQCWSQYFRNPQKNPLKTFKEVLRREIQGLKV